MTNWLTSREAVKRGLENTGAEQNAQIDRIILAASRSFEDDSGRYFIPRTETRTYRWTQRDGKSDKLWLDQDLISVTTLQTKAQDSSPTTISSSDYFLEPNNTGPPYLWIEIDSSSTAAFEAGDTPQRSISVEGSWGYHNTTESAGTVASGLDSSASATSFVCSDASAINVGDTLLIESEQVFVSDRSFAALGSILLNGSIDGERNTVTVTVDGSHGIVAGEVIQVDSERMFVISVATNDLTVLRAYDGTTLASHADDATVQINRTLTIVRGVNGTTAATHADATSISRYVVPGPAEQVVRAEAIATLHQEQAGYGRSIGGGEGAAEFSGTALARQRDKTLKHYGRKFPAAV